MRSKRSRLKKSECSTSEKSVAEGWRRYSRRIAVAVSLSVILIGGVLILTTAAAPQTETVTPTEQTAAITPDPPGTIDGAKNPELIPDDLAYQLVFLGVAEREDATEAQKDRFRAKIASAGLNEDDTVALLVILAAFQKQLDALNAQADQILARDPLPFPGTPDYQQLLELTKQREPIFAEAMSALPARLSLAGAAQFQAYIQNQKRVMKYIPDMAMPRN